jgi:DNA invertase Pin-like site-specific DNA recombinase
MATARIFAYLCGSTDPARIPSADRQNKLIESHCKKRSLVLDGTFIDRAAASEQPFQDREAGRQLWLELRSGDSVIVAHTDRLAHSFSAFARLLDDLTKRGVTLHLLDLGCSLSSTNPQANTLVKLITALAKCGRGMNAQKTRTALQRRKAEGKRFTRIAPYGFAWRRRGKQTVMVHAPGEQRVMRHVAEMKAAGYSLDEIRQFLAYEWQVRNRNGKDFGLKEIATMARRGAELLRAERSAIA